MLSDERALATRLASLDDVALSDLFAARGVSPSASWHDFFDAAAALLDDAAIDRVLAGLPLGALRDLAAGAAPALSRLALADADGAPYSAVAERLDAALAAQPGVLEPAPSPEPARADAAGEAAAAEAAVAMTGALADLLLATLRAPLARTGSGTVSAIDRRRLADAGIVESADDLEDLVAAAEAAGLMAESGREWVATAQSERWLETPTLRRWQDVVAGLRDALPAGVRTPAGGVLAPAAWASAYPLDADWPARATRFARVARRLGLTAPNGEEPEWTRALRLDGTVATDPLARLIPAEIDRVYLQADLTAIAPGPLAPHLDLRLRGIAVRESRAQASSYRFTAESLGTGMTAGETAASIREFLSELSLTGIPQPLDYLIESTSARHGLVRIATDSASGRTRVTSSDAAVLEAIGVDQALRALGLVRDGDALVSRVVRDAVYWTLADARYPVVAVDDAGAPEALHRRVAARPVAASPADGGYERLIAGLRASHGADADAAWLTRELEQAVRARAVIGVTVRLPDGSDREFMLEATGLGGGRLRGRDRAADIERTLPVASITSVRPTA